MIEEKEIGETSEIDFSMIGLGGEDPKHLNFSVEELFTNPKINESVNSSNHEQTNKTILESEIPEGSFLQALQKIEKSISFESNPHDIYDPSSDNIEVTKTAETKYEENSNNTIPIMIISVSRVDQSKLNHLIIDFDDPCCHNLKNREKNENQIVHSDHKTSIHLSNSSATKKEFQDKLKKILSPKSQKIENKKVQSSCCLPSPKQKQKESLEFQYRKLTKEDSVKMIKKCSSMKSIKSCSTIKSPEKREKSSSKKEKSSEKREKSLYNKNKQKSDIFCEFYELEKTSNIGKLKKKKNKSINKTKLQSLSYRNILLFH